MPLGNLSLLSHFTWTPLSVVTTELLKLGLQLTFPMLVMSLLSVTKANPIDWLAIDLGIAK